MSEIRYARKSDLEILKTLELYESQYAKYTKKPAEDLNRILTGISQPK